MRSFLFVPALLVVTLGSSVAEAHRPFFAYGFFGTRPTAFPARDPMESIVVNQTVTCDHQALWVRFDAHAGDPIYIQVGVPKTDRLDGYRPRVALVGPGIDGTLPIDAGGLPGRILPPLSERHVFVDKESDTSSWVYVETTETMPKDGAYYIAAWPEDFHTGKLWVAIGNKETFGMADLPLFPIWIDQLNLFYEKMASEPVGEACTPAPELSAPAATPPPPESSGGCQQSGGPASGSVFGGLLLALLVVVRSRLSRPAI